MRTTILLLAILLTTGCGSLRICKNNEFSCAEPQHGPCPICSEPELARMTR